MPARKNNRNKAIVQLYKLGNTKHSILLLFPEMGKRNLYAVIKRDYNRYPLPSAEEIKRLAEEYSLTVENIIKVTQIIN